MTVQAGKRILETVSVFNLAGVIPIRKFSYEFIQVLDGNVVVNLDNTRFDGFQKPSIVFV